MKAYAQNHLERLRGAVDLAKKQREDDRRYFSQLFESLRMELGLVKAENAALKNGLAEQRKVLDYRCAVSMASVTPSPLVLAGPQEAPSATVGSRSDAPILSMGRPRMASPPPTREQGADCRSKKGLTLQGRRRPPSWSTC